MVYTQKLAYSNEIVNAKNEALFEFTVKYGL